MVRATNYSWIGGDSYDVDTEIHNFHLQLFYTILRRSTFSTLPTHVNIVIPIIQWADGNLNRAIEVYYADGINTESAFFISGGPLLLGKPVVAEGRSNPPPSEYVA